jgi:hypothetical protein
MRVSIKLHIPASAQGARVTLTDTFGVTGRESPMIRSKNLLTERQKFCVLLTSYVRPSYPLHFSTAIAARISLRCIVSRVEGFTYSGGSGFSMNGVLMQSSFSANDHATAADAPNAVELPNARDVPRTTPSWLARIFEARAARRSPVPRRADSAALLAFVPEDRLRVTHSRRRLAWLVTASAGIVAAVGFAAAARIRERPVADPAATVQSGRVTINTRPEAAEVVIDGQRQGTTPVSLTLTPGPHLMAIRLNGTERVVPLAVAAGSETSHYLELAVPESRATSRGRLSVATHPPGARVKIDGRLYGTSPVEVADVTAGRHVVSVESDTASAERTITVGFGDTTSVVFSLPRDATTAAQAGWVTIAAPFDVQVLERGEVIGSSDATKLMMAAGRHEVVLVNQGLGYQESRRVDVLPGRVATVRIEPPKAAVSVNARPWANVTIDANDLGQTPIANVLVPIGRHRVTFRHPQLGDREQTVVVTTKGPNRITADLNR